MFRLDPASVSGDEEAFEPLVPKALDRHDNQCNPYGYSQQSGSHFSLQRSRTALGAAFRRTARYKGGAVAIFVIARKLAILVYWPVCVTSVSFSTSRYRRSLARRKESDVGRMQVVRHGGLLKLMEPGPAITPKTRETVLPLMATLLLEAAATSPTVTKVAEARGTEDGDEQDRA